ncbi:hypothetical protein C2I18_12165 [Paenibacillus sp. PK3_47]|nr:hypothetical protein C2I18_12165 [Paenibacillus sp. PK3_47]
MARPRGLARKRAGLAPTVTDFRTAGQFDKLPGVQRAGALGALPAGRVWEGQKEAKKYPPIKGGQGDIKRLELTI